MSVIVGDTVYFIIREFEDIFFKNGESHCYSLSSKEMILKGEILTIKNNIIIVKLLSDKKSSKKDKTFEITINDIINKTSIPTKLLGIWN